MRSKRIIITLQQPLVASLQAASAGAHQSLDFIPGATLLGHAAARLYPQLAPAEAWAIFHSGHVRFGDALPLAKHAPTAPMPLAWHGIKGEKITGDDGRLIAGRIHNAVYPTQDTGRQPQQLRNGYISQDGAHISVRRQQTLKTAIDPNTGMAAESQLFGYEALDAGQRFSARICADACIDEALWLRLLDALGSSARLGRSRSAQFGLVHLQLEDDLLPETKPSVGNTLLLWLLSDLALECDGQPCLQPHAPVMGLPEGVEWDPSRSFLRQRSYSPYNAYRRSYDPQRQVIARGSVLVYDTKGHTLDTQAVHRLQSGVGLHVEAGLGHVVVNSPLLADAEPRFAPLDHTQHADTSRPKAGTPSALGNALRARARRLSGTGADIRADKIYRQWLKQLDQAYHYNTFCEPPGRTQWGGLKGLASDLRTDVERLQRELLDNEKGPLRARSGWGTRYGIGPEQTLGHWLQAQLKDQPHLPELLGELATLVLAQPERTNPAGDRA